jgi:protein-L-isoaspartate(D-aspartate) O-methyltransferase
VNPDGGDQALVVSPVTPRYKPPTLAKQTFMSDYAAARLNMVETQVRPNDVTDIRIQKAMLEIPREEFVPARLRSVAYMEGCIEVAKGRWLLDARCFSKLAQLAGLRSEDLVLDVGCATGYSTAVLARAAHYVIALEEEPALAHEARAHLDGIANAEVVEGRLTAGLPQRAPFDVIFLNGACDSRPEALLAQLKDGGRLVCVIREGAQGHAHLFVKGEDASSDRMAFDAQVPVLPGFERVAGFAF